MAPMSVATRTTMAAAPAATAAVSRTRRSAAVMATKKIGQERVLVPGGGLVDVKEQLGSNIKTRRRFLAEVKDIRNTENDIVAKPKLLKNVEKLRLLSKAEQLGLLSLAENFGLTLEKIEELELLSTAESLGVFSAVEDRDLPTKLLLPALALYALAPAAVYVIPDDGTPLVAAQALLAFIGIAGGSALFGASQLVGKLQR